MAKPKKLSSSEITTIEKNFLTYTRLKSIGMFTYLFKKFHSQKKLDFALKHIDYQPFKDALKDHDYSFFYQLTKALPQERYKKLMLIYNENVMIKLFFSSLADCDLESSNMQASILKVWYNIFSLLPEEAAEIFRSYPENQLKEIIINENNDGKLLLELSEENKISNLLEKRTRIDDVSDEVLPKK
jgi:hypothetical protein